MTDAIDLDPFQCPSPFPADPHGSYPILHDWKARRIDSDIHLTGIVRNHPRLPDGAIQTSALCEIACDRSWARTLNILYLLGDAAAEKTSGARRKLGPATAPQTRPGLVVIREIGGNTLTGTGREVHSEFQKLIGATMPLAETPDLAAARQVLASEFPHCMPAIDAILGDLTGRPTIRWHPSLFVGAAAVGKSRLANRLPAALGMPEPSRFDAAGASNNAFGGTPRRWSTGEPSAPLEAVRRSGIANPCLILDDVERAATSRHNGRFSNSLLPFLCAETSRVHFDPFLESPANLSAINYLATATDELDLPKELRDRFRLLRISEPSAEHLPALARTLAREIAAERGIAAEWGWDLDSFEIDVASRLWHGGSIRRLRSIVEIIISKRDQLALRH